MNLSDTQPVVIDNALTRVLRAKKQDILNIFCTAGYPQLDSTPAVLEALEAAGADLVEVGIPFSDPLADGPVIQQSSMQALDNGMSLALLFEQLAGRNSSIPIILMGYLNPVMQYGMEAFCAKCAEVGVSGVILPDLPLEIYLSEYQSFFEAHNLCNIFLITPQTAESRIREIDRHSTGFIYAVSSASTTGSKSGINDAGAYLARIQSMALETPVLTGFNIRDKASFDQACQFTNGAIIGSAFIKSLSNSPDLSSSISSFIHQIKPS